jgi:regulatory protein
MVRRAGPDDCQAVLMGRRARSESLAQRRTERAALTDAGPVMEAAAAFLAVRPRSIAETKRRLRQHGYPEELVERVVDELIELGYLDDEAFARAWVESRDRAHPRGETALRRELALKGVTRDVIAEVLAGRDQAAPTDHSADMSAAMRLLDRRRSALERQADPAKRRQKVYALLARNGFDPEVCREAASAFVERR